MLQRYRDGALRFITGGQATSSTGLIEEPLAPRQSESVVANGERRLIWMAVSNAQLRVAGGEAGMRPPIGLG